MGGFGPAIASKRMVLGDSCELNYQFASFAFASYSSASYIDRLKDTLKVSGVQVSPSEIESTLIEHPGGLIADAAVAGVAGTRMADEHVPRAWIVLSEKGLRAGPNQVTSALDAWVKERLSSPKWVRGGYEIVVEVSLPPNWARCEVLLIQYIDSEVSYRQGSSTSTPGGLCWEIQELCRRAS